MKSLADNVSSGAIKLDDSLNRRFLKLRRRAACLALAAFCAASGGVELLDRGAVAFPKPEGGVYLSWRLLAGDPADVVFDVYRESLARKERVKVSEAALANGTNFVDASGLGGEVRYVVESRSLGNSRVLSTAVAERGDSDGFGGFVRVKLQGNYQAQKVGLADFDGDGKLDYLVKQPNFNVDPSQAPGYWKKSPEPY